MALEAPSGKLKPKSRDFYKIVHDMRHIVYGVLRQRPDPDSPLNPDGTPTSFLYGALGSGFFVSQQIFVTCEHVVNDEHDRHQEGDTYALVANLPDGKPRILFVTKAHTGTNIFLYPQFDFAVLKIDKAEPTQPYVHLHYADVHIGQEIGVAGYPLPNIRDAAGKINLQGLTYRAARGHVTGRYSGTLTTESVPVVEVNFLFVPGNSGGPVFSAEDGKVYGFVSRYNPIIIHEKVTTVSRIKPENMDGVGDKYVAAVHALYSLAFKLDCVRGILEGFGVTL